MLASQACCVRGGLGLDAGGAVLRHHEQADPAMGMTAFGPVRGARSGGYTRVGRRFSIAHGPALSWTHIVCGWDRFVLPLQQAWHLHRQGEHRPPQPRLGEARHPGAVVRALGANT